VFSGRRRSRVYEGRKIFIKAELPGVDSKDLDLSITERSS